MDEDFARPGQAELETCPLLNRFIPGFEITHFGIECRIALFELLIDGLLGRKLAINFPGTQPAALPQP